MLPSRQTKPELEMDERKRPVNLGVFSNLHLVLLISAATEEQKAPLVLEMRKRAFIQGLADRLAGKPLMARDDDGDDEYWADAYICGYDPRNELDMARPEFREKCAADVIELTKLTGSVIPDALPRNRCEFPNDKFSVEIPKVGTVKAESLEELGDNAWDAVHMAPNSTGYGYGASEIGSGWPVKRNGKPIGTMRYNGKFDAQEI
jgi:hypothetical protein